MPERNGRLDDAWRAIEALEQRRAKQEEDVWERIRRLRTEASRRLYCVECGFPSEDYARGWKLRLDVDDELVAFCPDCDREEFGDA